MKYFYIPLILLFTSFGTKSECLFVEDKSKISELLDLRKMANLVMDAEGKNCDDIKDTILRSSCQCKYRKTPLIQFRADYASLLKNNPNYSNRMVCFSKGNNGISINFIGYEHISKWCR
ncbi:hypothetical protein AADZ91_18195 [Colwelliaceae bacterium 6441]